MQWETVAAGLIFTVTYALIAVRRMGGADIRMPYAAAAGAVLMVLTGIVSPSEAADSIDFGTLFLLLGMMLMASALEVCGFFDIAVSVLIRNAVTGRRFLLTVMVLSAVLSAVMLNDAVVLLLTPAVIGCCISLKARPVPYLVGTFVSANIGSAATAVGNPQNAYIASKAGIDFLTFSGYMVPLSVMCLIASYLILAHVFSKDLGMQPAEPAAMPADRTGLKVLIALLICTMAMFALSGIVGLELYQIALCAGALALLVACTRGRAAAVRTVTRVDWGVLLFFIGLFVIMAGAVDTGLVSAVADLFPGFSDGSPSIGEMTLFSSVLSNLISNVPAVMLIGEMVPVGDTALWMTLAASSTLAGNMTLIGAAANVIVEEEAEKEGRALGFTEYLKAGIPVSAVTLAMTWAWCTLVF